MSISEMNETQSKYITSLNNAYSTCYIPVLQTLIEFSKHKYVKIGQVSRELERVERCIGAFAFVWGLSDSPEEDKIRNWLLFKYDVNTA